MTMIFRSLFVSLLAAIVFRGTAAEEDLTNIILTSCSEQAVAIAVCLQNNGVTNTTFENLDVAACQTCIEMEVNIQNDEQLQQTPCSEIQPLVSEALAGCASQCALDEDCEAEIKDLMSCGFANGIECREDLSSAVSPSIYRGMTIAAMVVAIMVIVAA